MAKRGPKIGIRHDKSSGRAYCTWQGKRKYLGKWGSAESVDRFRELMRVANSDDTPKAPPGNVAELFIAYLEHRRTLSTTRKTYLDYVRFLEFAGNEFQGLYIDDLGPKKLKDARNKYQAGRSANSANKFARAVIDAYRWAVEEELIKVELYQALATLKPAKPDKAYRPRPANLADVDKLEGKLIPVMWDVVQLCRFTGARLGEICKMRPCDIDQTSKELWLYVPPAHKNTYRGKDRTIYLGPQSIAVVARRLVGLSKADKVFDVHPDSVTHAVARECKALGIKWTVHQLRHRKGTDIRAAFGAESAQVMLGHANLKTTEIYAEKDDRQMRKVARKVN